MPEPEFWKLVDDLGWGTKTTDYKALKKRLVRNMSPNQAAAFSTTLATLRGKLYKVVEQWEDEHDSQIGLGDDGFGDLLHHIIGLGKREYYAALRNPALAHARALKNDFTESFSYATPYTSDYRLLDVGEYRQRGEKVVEVAGWLAQRPESREVQKALRVLVDGFDVLGRRGAHEFIAQEEALVGAAKIVEDWWEKMLRDLGWSRSGDALVSEMPAKLMEVSHLYHTVKNIITDMKDYLLD
jgi:hypothetical protein